MTGRLCIIYTGGTFGMRRAGDSYVPAPDLAALIAARLPELSDPAMPAYDLEEYAKPIESANATPGDWYRLAADIHGARDAHDGFIVIHGTDTLAYTASALSFLLAGLNKPVLVTGSQIPLCEVRNDAQANLLSAVQAIATGRLAEVAVCFGRRILRGNRATKVSATELDAFLSPNFSALAEIGTHIRFNEVNGLPAVPAMTDAPIAYRDVNLAVLRLYPGMPAAIIDALTGTGIRGLILRCYGVGTAPTGDRAFLDALDRADRAGVLTVAVSECLEGRVSLGRYAAGARLADRGVISGHDMTTEAAFTKMHVLFAQGLSREKTAQAMQRNLRGELTAG